MKQKLIALLLAWIMCLMPCAAQAVQLEKNFLQDEAGYLQEADRLALEQQAGLLQEQTGIYVGMLTVEDLAGQEAEVYLSEQAFCQQQMESGEAYIFLLFDQASAVFYAYAGNGAEQNLVDGDLDAMREYGLACTQEGGDLQDVFADCMEYVAQKASPQDGGALSYVEDAAGLLTQAEIAASQTEAERLYKGDGHDVVIVTTEDTNGKSTMEFADDYFDYNGYSDEGLLLLVDMGSREWWISTEGSCIEAFTDTEIQAIGEAVAGYLSAEDYKGAFDEFLWWVDYELSNYDGTDVGEDVPERLPAGSATVFIVDEAQLLTEAQEQALEVKIAQLRDGYSNDVVIVTTGDTDGKSAMEYADDYYDYNGYANDGLLLLIDMDNREWWISTKGDGIYAFSDREIQKAGKKIVKSLKSEDYMQACEVFLIEVDEELYDYYDGQMGPVFREAGFSGNLKRWWRNINWTAVLIAEAVAIAAAFIIVGIMKRGMKTARPKNQAQDYIRPGSFQLTNSADIYLYSHTTSRRIEHDTDSGGGSSTHTSSSGDTHGGGGGSF